LIVDDEVAIREGLAMLMEAESIDSTEAGDRDSAVELLAKTFFPVIIADLCLKTTADGLRLLDEIRRLSSRSRIVTISGYVTPELEEEVKRRGVSLVLHKPMTNDVIMAAIHDLVAEIEREAAASPEMDDAALYAKVQKVLYSIPRRKYGLSHDAAEDIVQQAWLLFLQKRAFVRDARTWLAGTAVNLSRQELQRFSRITDGDPAGVFDATPDERPNELDVIAVRQALKQLDPRSRELCEWIGLEGFSYDEVSNATAVPLGSVGPSYLRAKKRLRSVLMN
jgi:RNA polymerase sigma factor (sigma-70 family)